MQALEQITSWPVGSATVAVLDRDGEAVTSGPGVAYAWASITKLLTALTVLLEVQDGLLELDAPAGPAGSTVRHLLAHAAGVAPDSDAVASPPERRRIYSNRGYELLGELVTARTGVPFPERLAARVLEPLGMAATSLQGSPAHGAKGPVADLAALGWELLAPTLLEADLAAEMTRPAFPGLAGVLPGFGRQEPNDWGLGPEIRGGKSPHWTGASNAPGTFGHFGRAGGFLWVDPQAGLALACLTDRDFDTWAAQVWPKLSDDVLAGAAGGLR